MTTLLAIDQGTTSSRAILFDLDGAILAVRQKELTLHYPHNGWVEQNALDIWHDTQWACRAVLADAPEHAAACAAIGITNQRETTVIWDRKTGQPVYNAIVWQDRRTADECVRLKKEGREDMIRARTGLLLDPYFSATKIKWILDSVPGARARAEKGELAFGTVDCWLLWNLTGGKSHATDATNASRTMLFNIRTRQWDDELLKLFNIPRTLLPEVKDNVAAYGATAEGVLLRALPVGGMAGDQQAALIGQACFSPGMTKITYGTGCFALMNSGSEFRESKNRLLTTIGYSFDGRITYALEGSIFVAGAAVQWLRDGLGLFKKSSESEALATSIPGNDGVYFVPAFTGLGAPYWDPQARAAILGLTRASTAAHITRAALEAQAYQTRDLCTAMAADAGFMPGTLRADGGLVANKFVCQFVADILDRPLEVPGVIETTAWGAACLAALSCGAFAGLDTVAARWSRARRYEPALPAPQREALYSGWKAAVARVLHAA